MISTKKAIKLSGILFLTAMASSLAGGGIIETEPDHPLLFTGVFLEVLNAISVMGIGILLYPVLKRAWKNAAHVYLAFRIMEALVCLSAAIIPLFIFESNSSLRAFHTGTLIPLFFCGGALIFYTVLFFHQLLPRYISIWGWMGVLLIVYLNVYHPQGDAAMLFALPIILNEIFLGTWLIVKGFNGLAV